MRVSAIAISSTAEHCELRGTVASDIAAGGDHWFPPCDLWYRFPRWCEPYLDVDNGDPFLAALLFLAMQTGGPLTIDAPVSPRLLAATREIQAIYGCFDPGCTPVAVDSLARGGLPTGDRPGAAQGLFFSLGVDSFYSLLKNRGEDRTGAQAITHLIAIHGFDVGYDDWDERFPNALLANMQRVAAAAGATLLPVTTNVRREVGQRASWIMAHGAALASVALALGGLFAQVRIAASTTYDKLFPWGSHPVLDPLWSTEALSFRHDGCEISVIDKTAFLADFPLALDTLRPCAGYGQGYNCGRCLKCVRTMLDLYRVDALERCTTLPHTIDPAVLREALRGRSGPAHVLNYQRRLAELRRVGAPPDLIAVLAEHVATLQGTPRDAPAGRPRIVDSVLRRVGGGRLG